MILREFSNTGDAISTAMFVLKILSETNGKLSKLRNQIHLFSKKSVNIEVDKKIPLEKIDGLDEFLSNLEKSNPDCIRVLLRYSGTENKLRLLVEAKSEFAAGKISTIVQDYIIPRLSQYGISNYGKRTAM